MASGRLSISTRRIPWWKAALIFSGFAAEGSVNERSNEPYRRSASADHLVGGAFEQGGEVEELGAAELLDSAGQGVAARLRYRLER